MASSERSLLPSLPLVLTEEILHRTPAKSLIRFKLTCKKWDHLIKDKRFIYNHLDHSPERFIRIHNDETVHVMDPKTGIRSVSPIPNEFRNPFPISSMVHCDGLMLCICDDLNNGRIRYANLAVWNPVLRKFKWIKPSVCYWGTDYFGIGYDNASRDNYKILRFSGHMSFGRVDSDPKCESEIYDFNSGSWRSIDAKFDVDVDTECEGMSVKGNMYWIAEKKEDFIILSFDFSMETFKNICVCPSSYWKKRLGCFNGDKLSLLLQDENSKKIEVWVTNKLSDEAVTFSKYFSVTSPDLLPALQFQDHMARPGYSIGKHRNIMAWCEGQVEEDGKWYARFTLYEIDQGGVRRQIETGRHEEFNYHNPLICSYVYVPSLIPVPK